MTCFSKYISIFGYATRNVCKNLKDWLWKHASTYTNRYIGQAVVWTRALQAPHIHEPICLIVLNAKLCLLMPDNGRNELISLLKSHDSLHRFQFPFFFNLIENWTCPHVLSLEHEQPGEWVMIREDPLFKGNTWNMTEDNQEHGRYFTVEL